MSHQSAICAVLVLPLLKFARYADDELARPAGPPLQLTLTTYDGDVQANLKIPSD